MKNNVVINGDITIMLSKRGNRTMSRMESDIILDMVKKASLKAITKVVDNIDAEEIVTGSIGVIIPFSTTEIVENEIIDIQKITDKLSVAIAIEIGLNTNLISNIIVSAEESSYYDVERDEDVCNESFYASICGVQTSTTEQPAKVPQACLSLGTSN